MHGEISCRGATARKRERGGTHLLGGLGSSECARAVRRWFIHTHTDTGRERERERGTPPPLASLGTGGSRWVSLCLLLLRGWGGSFWNCNLLRVAVRACVCTMVRGCLFGCVCVRGRKLRIAHRHTRCENWLTVSRFNSQKCSLGSSIQPKKFFYYFEHTKIYMILWYCETWHGPIWLNVQGIVDSRLKKLLIAVVYDNCLLQF